MLKNPLLLQVVFFYGLLQLALAQWIQRSSFFTRNTIQLDDLIGWSYQGITNCTSFDNLSVLGGLSSQSFQGLGGGSTITKQITQLSNHYKTKVIFSIFFFENAQTALPPVGQSNRLFIFKADGVEILTDTFPSFNGQQEVKSCGPSARRIIKSYSISFPHSSENITLSFSDGLSDAKTLRGWGIRDVKVYTQLCHFSCSQCSGKDDQCQTCIQNAEFTADRKYCQCSVGYFSSSVTPYGCSKCSNSCEECSGPSEVECTNCRPNSLLIDGRCVCNPGYYFGKDNNCILCDKSCRQCTGPGVDECLTCFENGQLTILIENCPTGICICPQGQSVVYNPGFTCQKCHDSCADCSKSNPYECVSCPQNAIIQSAINAAGERFCFCKNLFFPSVLRPLKCSACDASCSACNLQGVCTSCKDSNAILTNGLCPCKSGFFQSPDSSCQPCSGNCKECSSQNFCTACVDNTYIVDGQCRCLNGFTQIVKEAVLLECRICHPRCLTCLGLTNNDCTTCVKKSVLITSGVVQLVSTGQCICLDQTYLVSENPFVCNDCHASCLSCSGPSAKECLSCFQNASLQSDGSCLCDVGLYFQPNSQQCLPCTRFCGLCDVKAPLICLLCIHPLTRLVNNVCIPIPGYYVNDNNDFGKCHLSCYECYSGGMDECTSCRPGFLLVNGQCVCPPGLSPNPLQPYDNCFVCDSSCAKCIGTASNQCSQCYEGFFFDGNGRCICDLQSGWVNLLQPLPRCVKCHQNCLTCSETSSTSCLSCPLGQILKNGSCLCPANQYKDPNIALLTCLNCDVTCKRCSSASPISCLECYPNAALSSGQCFCVPGFFYSKSEQKCLQCRNTCITCEDRDDNCTKCVANTNLVQGSCFCKDNFTFNAATGKCEPCAPNCLRCTAENKNFCTACAPNAILSGTTCECAPHFYQVTSSSLLQCSPCHISCQGCVGSNSSNSCTDCYPNFSLTRIPTNPPTNNAKIGSCNCLSGYFLDLINPTICSPCDSCCKTCQGKDDFCTSCLLPNQIIINGVCDCPKGFYLDLATGCIPCHYSCKSCTGRLSNECSECFNSGIIFKDYRCTCPDGYIISRDGTVCLACSTNCKRCLSSNLNICTDCYPTSILDKTGFCKCPAGFYSDKSSPTFKCLACHPNCLTCSGPTSSECLSCRQDLYIAKDNTCVCLPGFYNKSNTNVVVCAACAAGCKTCIGQATNCTSCFCNQILTGSSCVCEAGFQLGSANLSSCCKQCDTLCAACNNHGICSSCKPNAILQADGACFCKNGFFLQSYSPFQCQQCHSKCLTCFGGSSDQCLTCKQGLILNKSVCECEYGFFEDPTTRLCQACTGNCAACYFSSSSCTDCLQNASLINSQCVCYSGFFLNASTKQCEICDSNCETCLNSAKNCTSCSANATLKNAKCLCNPGYYQISTSASGLVFSLQCLPCSYICKTCSSSPSFCLTCADPLAILDAGAGNCNCPSGYFSKGITSFCTKCDTSCSECNGIASNNCIACRPNTTLTPTNECQCNVGFFYDFRLFKCLPCDPNCVTCQGASTQCITCSANAEKSIINVCQCKIGFFAKARDDGVLECLPCSNICTICAGSADRCFGCKPGATLQRDLLTCICDFGFYLNPSSGDCLPCSPSCKSCSGSSASDKCTSCYENSIKLAEPIGACVCAPSFYISATLPRLVCSKCNSRCLSCSTSPINCETCYPNAILNPITRTCACSPGTYLFSVSPFLCSKCDDSCLTCESNGSNCTSCKQNSALVNGKCVCSDGYVLNGTVCIQCNPECKTCVQTCEKCSSCFSDSDFDAINQTCKCKPGSYRDNANPSTCKVCVRGCRECGGDQQSPTCSKCAPNAVYDALSRTCNCNPGFYTNPLNVGDFCLPCHSSCVTCQGPAKSECKSCKANTNPIILGECICIDGYALDPSTNTCAPCNKLCLTCSGIQANNCITCYSQANLTSSNQCICKSGYFLNSSTFQCNKCHGSCQNCLGPLDTDCTTCFANAAAPVGGRGKCICEQGYSLAANGSFSCLPCDSSCVTCVNGNQSQCLTCRVNAAVDPVRQLCACQTGFFLDKVSLNCLPCSQTCLTCAGTSNSCTSCRSPSQLQANSCVCTDGFFYESFSFTCKKCSSTCKTCELTATNCKSCNDFQTRVSVPNIQEFTCRCNSGYFLALTSPVQTCQACHWGCKECVDAASSSCVPCVDNAAYLITNNTPNRECLCNPGFYHAQRVPQLVCNQCIPFCTGCSDNYTCNICLEGFVVHTDGTCKVKDGWYLERPSLIVKKCPVQCRTCDGPLTTNCITCNDFASLSANRECLCINGFFRSNVDPLQACQPCDSSCNTCYGPASNNCLSCKNLTSLSNGQCLCSSGYFWSSANNQCLQCSSTCLTCANSFNFCLSCPVNATLDRLTNSCSCNAGYFWNAQSRSCVKCDSSCKTCNGAFNICTACFSDSILSNNACRCIDGKYRNQADPSTCLTCAKTCKTCSFADQCDTCIENTYKPPGVDLCQVEFHYYQNDDMNLPKICHPRCLECNGPNENNCLSCYPNAHLNIAGQRTCDCDTSFAYPLGTSALCVSCNPNCTSCLSNNKDYCLTCVINATPVNGVCSCKSNEFVDALKNCKPCNPVCATCFGSGANQCIQCQTGFTLDSNSRQCVCADGYYLDVQSSTCKPCYQTCAKCSGGTADKCISCAKPTFVLSNSQCICQPGFFYEFASNSCLPCGIYCATCKNATTCDTCNDSNAVLSPTGVCQCKTAMVRVPGNNLCQACFPSCASCSGTQQNQCLACFSSANLQLDGTCACSSKFFRNPSDATACLPCDNSCLTCKDLAQNCLSCNPNASLQGNKCVCNDGYYMNPMNGQCQLCAATCSRCLNATVCVECLDKKVPLQNGQCGCSTGFFLDTANGSVCSPCDASCATCKGPLDTQCLSCSNLLMTLGANGKCSCLKGFQGCSGSCIKCADRCLTCQCSNPSICIDCIANASFPNFNVIPVIKACQCNQGFYYNVANNTCEACHNSCSKCNGPLAADCTLCTALTVPRNRLCVCKPGFYSDANDQGRCKPCDSTCSTCSGPSANQCLLCPFNAALAADNTCACIIGTYRNPLNANECLSCALDCKTCKDSLNNSCTSCYTDQNFLLSPSPTSRSIGQCVCADGYQYLQDTVLKGYCRLCHVSCKTCDGVLNCNCLSCPDNAELLNTGFCRCKTGFYLASNGKDCLKCDLKCETCSGPSENECLSCNTNASLTNNRCDCNLGFYLSSSNVCTACSSNCQKCTANGGCSVCSTGFTLGGNPPKCTLSSGYFLFVPKISSSSNHLLNDALVQSLPLQCHSSCASCTGPHLNECTECHRGAHLDLKTGSCQCKSGYYRTSPSQNCHQCAPACMTCSNQLASSCSSCIQHASFSAKESKCMCDEGFVFSENSEKCEKLFNVMTTECTAILTSYLSSSQMKALTQFGMSNPSVEVSLDSQHSLIPTQCYEFLAFSVQLRKSNSTTSQWVDLPSLFIEKLVLPGSQVFARKIKLPLEQLSTMLSMKPLPENYFQFDLGVTVSAQIPSFLSQIFQLHMSTLRRSFVVMDILPSSSLELSSNHKECDETNPLSPGCFLATDLDTISFICSDKSCQKQRENHTFAEGETVYISMKFIDSSNTRSMNKKSAHLIHEGIEIMDISDLLNIVEQNTQRSIFSLTLPKQANNLYLQILAEIVGDAEQLKQANFLQDLSIDQNLITTSADFSQLSVIPMSVPTKSSSGESLIAPLLMMILSLIALLF